MWRLPPLPPAIGLLTTAQSQALDLRFPQAKQHPAKCETCRGTKTFRWYGHGDEVVDYACPCSDQYLLSRWLWNCGILPKYQRLGWRDFERLPDDVAQTVSGYLANIDRAVQAGLGMIITGPRGNGKTLLAHLVLKEVIGRGVDAYATSFTAMIDIFAEGWRDKAQAQWFNSRLRDASVLFIDDLGRERNKGSGSVGDNMLETVLRHRVACTLPTIITSNIEGEKIGEAYGGHTESLLSECSIMLNVVGSDIRRDMQARMVREMTDGITRPVVLS